MKSMVIRKILSTILTVLLCLIMLLLSGFRLLGWIPLAVLSGSMEPQYPVGSLIFVRPVAAEDVKLGDPITFYMADGRTLATHRGMRITACKYRRSWGYLFQNRRILFGQTRLRFCSFQTIPP